MKININSGTLKESHRIAGHVYRQGATIIACSILSICVGMTFGITAVLLPQLKEDEEFPYNEIYATWIASVSPLAMIVGCIGAGSILDILGRRTTILLLIVPYLLGWILLGFSTNSSMAILARIVVGLANGACRPSVMIFLGEIATPSYRGVALFLPSMTANLGVIICHGLSKYVNWRVNVWICGLPCLISFMIILFVKESPLWLISKGRPNEGIQAFQWYRGSSENALKELNESLGKETENTKFSAKELLMTIFSKMFLKPFSTTLLLFFVAQLCGVNTLSFYALDILRVTFNGDVDEFSLMMITDCVRVIGSTCVCLCSKFFSRRKTFFTCSVGTILALITLIVILYTKPQDMLWVPVSSLICFVGFGSMLASLSWSFVGEIFPADMRGIGSGLSTAVSFMLLFISVQTTPGIMESLGVIFMYGIFACVTFICSVLLTFLLPETYGKTLQEIEESYQNKNATKF